MTGERCWPQVREAGAGAKLLRVEDAAKSTFTVWLRDCWADTPLAAGDTVAVVAPWDAWGEATVTVEQGLLVAHPHVLLSATSVGAAFGCVRKAALQERFGGSSAGGAVFGGGGGGASKATFVGTLLHELFQVAMAEGAQTGPRGAPPRPPTEGSVLQRIRAEAAALVSRSALALFEVGMSEEEALADVSAALPGLAEWVSRARGLPVSPSPAPEQQQRGRPAGGGYPGAHPGGYPDGPGVQCAVREAHGVAQDGRMSIAQARPPDTRFPLPMRPTTDSSGRIRWRISRR